jgi:hypothetical protein
VAAGPLGKGISAVYMGMGMGEIEFGNADAIIDVSLDYIGGWTFLGSEKVHKVPCDK